MHDTAYQIGALAMSIYTDLPKASVLEIGSQVINGTLRDKALPTTKYVGIDIEEGEGVDVVSELGKPLPVEEGSFDLVMASSVFEHDPCFWVTFLEMCRATRNGGYIYLNAPSNGKVHRHPQDNWRFYPDSGQALEKWAVSQGHHVTLIESFIAEREQDQWNDFVAVFRKGRIIETQPTTFIHEHVPSVNVLTWRSNTMLREREEPQDRLLLQQANAKVQGAVAHVAELERRVGELEQQLTELQSARDQLTHRESEIRQSAEQAEARVQTLTAQIGSLAETDEQHRREIAQLIGNVRSNEIEAAAAKRRYDDEVAVLTTMLQQSEDRATTAEEGQAKGSREIRALSERVKELEAAVDELAGFARWSEQVRACLASQPAWWRFMPLAWRKKRERRRLRSARLFDSQAYHRRYPDVVAGGLDAIDHYFRHGVHEGRSRDF